MSQQPDPDFVNPLEPRHQCPICRAVIQAAMQADCGHIFCEMCLKKEMKEGERMLCPIDSEKIQQVFPDNACRKEIQRLLVRCRYSKKNGCPWVGVLREEDVHYLACEFRDEECPYCKQWMMYTMLKKHAEMECPMRRMTCKHCAEEITASSEQKHLDETCPAVEIQCPNKCSTTMFKRSELKQHLSLQGDCPLTDAKCPYKPLGCDFIGKKTELTKHLNDNILEHSVLTVQETINNRQKNEELLGQIQILDDKHSNLEIRVNNFEALQDVIMQKVDHLETVVSTVQESMSSGSSLTLTTAATRGTDVAAGLDGKIERVSEKYHNLSATVDKLMSNGVDQELRLQLIEQATYNGILVWKIDEITRRMEEAVKGSTVSLFSAPFYTDPRGYKMCARCYLNGDGIGKGSHFSLFFVVMRGLYDVLLRWPFQQRVTMTLINQAGGRNVSDTFRPDIRSSSFQRPLNREMNIASGCPRFIRIEDFVNGGFIKEDCIFVKVVVDCSDLYGSPIV